MTQPAEANSTSLFQVFAHADDDLYFANPDLYRLLAAGHRVTSVYLTAGEADGRNVDTRDPLRERAPVDFAGYMEARQSGLRSAYATMVLGKREAPGSGSRSNSYRAWPRSGATCRRRRTCSSSSWACGWRMPHTASP